MHKANELGWGWRTDSIEAIALWGARAIHTSDGGADIVHDRIDSIGPRAERVKLQNELKRSLPVALRAGFGYRPSSGDRTEIREIGDLVLHVRVCGGYVYLTAHVRSMGKAS